MGRASRNINGSVVLYADRTTDSMKKAISETRRRREKQMDFNSKHNITPKNVQRKLEDLLEIQDPLEEVSGKKKKGIRGKDDVQKDNRSVEELEAAMKEAAARLDFEEAARIRDLIIQGGERVAPTRA